MISTASRSIVVSALALSLSLAACNREAATDAGEEVVREPDLSATAPVGGPLSYACESGRSITVTYPDPATAQVSYDGREIAMRLVEAASGARYSGDDLEWWTRAREGLEEATLSRMGPNSDVGVAVLERCVRPSSSAGGIAPSASGDETPLILPEGPLSAPDTAAAAGTTTADGAPCRGPALTLAVVGTQGAAGTTATTLALTNRGSTVCTLQGYPTVGLIGADGQALASLRSEPRAPAGQREGTRPPTITIRPGERAYFDVSTSNVPSQGQSQCPSATRIQVTPPLDTARASVEARVQACGERVRVSPVRASEAEGG